MPTTGLWSSFSRLFPIHKLTKSDGIDTIDITCDSDGVSKSRGFARLQAGFGIAQLVAGSGLSGDASGRRVSEVWQYIIFRLPHEATFTCEVGFIIKKSSGRDFRRFAARLAFEAVICMTASGIVAGIKAGEVPQRRQELLSFTKEIKSYTYLANEMEDLSLLLLR